MTASTKYAKGKIWIKLTERGITFYFTSSSKLVKTFRIPQFTKGKRKFHVDLIANKKMITNNDSI
jgi:hypothetical protein